MSFLFSTLSAIASMFMMLKHPLTLVILLISLTLLMVVVSLYVLNSSWLSMLTFLIFLGGLLIIFTYLSALIPNEVYYMNASSLLLLLSPLFTMIFIEPTMTHSQELSLNTMISMNDTSSVLVFLIYLLLTLMVTMIMAQHLKSPLSQNNY